MSSHITLIEVILETISNLIWLGTKPIGQISIQSEHFVLQESLRIFCKILDKRGIRLEKSFLLSCVQNISDLFACNVKDIKTTVHVVEDVHIVFKILKDKNVMNEKNDDAYYLNVFEKIKDRIKSQYPSEKDSLVIAKMVFEQLFPNVYKDPGLSEYKIFFDQYKDDEMGLKYYLPNVVADDVDSVLKELDLQRFNYDHVINKHGEKSFIYLIIKCLKAIESKWNSCVHGKEKNYFFFMPTRIGECGKACRKIMTCSDMLYDKEMIDCLVRLVCVKRYDEKRDGEYIWNELDV